MNTIQRTALAMAICLGMAWSQTGPASWERVQALAGGEAIRVQTADRKHDGLLTRASETAIQLTGRDGIAVTVPRSEVTRIYTRAKSRRVRNTIIGTAAGIAIGVALYATFGRLLRNEGGEQTELILVTSTAIGAGAGAAIPGGQLRKVYDVKQVR